MNLKFVIINFLSCWECLDMEILLAEHNVIDNFPFQLTQ